MKHQNLSKIFLSRTCNVSRLLLAGILVAGSYSALFAASPGGSHSRHETKASPHSAPVKHSELGLQHEFAPPDEGYSLQEEYDVTSERTLLDEDERLKDRIEIALSSQDEKELVKFVDMKIGPEFKKKVLLKLGEIYELQGVDARIMALYEKFILEFPRDREVPKLYLKLGRMYRNSGANKTALAKFYNVLNVALSVPVEDLEEYQEISHRAQLEIAETFFSMGSYNQAAKYFKRLLRVKLVDEDYQNVLFKYAYTVYLSGNYQESIASMRSFLTSFPDSDLAPETRYLLSETFLKIEDPKSALKETLELLTAQISTAESNPENWLYWKKRTGNRLANQFYKEGNYLDALTIYNAMASVTNEPSWSWPVLYQIGLCYERLEMKPKAIEAYERILKDEEQMSTDSIPTDPTLKSISDMALWRSVRLDEDISMETDLRRVLNNA